MVIICYFKYICLASRKSYYSTPPFLPSPPTPHYPSPRTTTPPAPLPKGAGLRQGSLVSNTTIIRDTCNAQILQTLSAVKTEGSPPRLSSLPQTPPTPHYPPPSTTKNPNSRRRRNHNYSLFIIHYSSFIIHHSLFIKQKVRAFSDNGPRYKISM